MICTEAILLAPHISPCHAAATLHAFSQENAACMDRRNLCSCTFDKRSKRQNSACFEGTVARQITLQILAVAPEQHC